MSEELNPVVADETAEAENQVSPATAVAAEGAEAHEDAQSGSEQRERKKGGFLKKLDRVEQERDFRREEALRNREKPAEKVAETPKDEPPKRPVAPNEDSFKSYE